MNETSFMAVALGGDMNCYAVARGFYEAYGIGSVMVGKMPIFPTANSRLLEKYYDENLMDDDVLIKKLTEVEKAHPGKKKFLFGSNDEYVRHIVHNRERIMAISGDYIIPIVDEQLFDRLDDKDTFYEACDLYGLPHPRSVYFDFSKDEYEDLDMPFEYPVFMKPTSNVVYNPFMFEGKQKGYKIESEEQLKEVIGTVKKAGYPGSFVIQEYIEGDDESMYIFAAYSDSRGKVTAMTGAQTLMHDRTPELIGNYDAMTDARDDAFCEKLKYFLEQIGVVGVSHFDVQWDKKRNDYVVYEINLRQGRSNYFMIASGVNYAKLLVEDYIEGKESPFFMADKPFIVSMVPPDMLREAVGSAKVDRVPPEDFYRFTLAPYDKNIKNTLFQKKNDRRTMENFRKYNKQDI